MPKTFLLGVLLLTIAASEPAGQKKTTLFSDEFSGASGSGFDTSKWTAETGGSGWGNQELQFYTGDSANVRLDGNGNLEIVATRLSTTSGRQCWYGPCRFASARLITKGKFEFKYGRAEARIKVPRGLGVWPAFWMLGSNIEKVGWPSCGEIDIMEFIGKEPFNVYGTVHGPGYSGDDAISRWTTLPENAKISDDFHIFAVEWSGSEIRWYLDGKRFSSISKRDLPRGVKWAFKRPHFLILNFAVGGKWPGSPDASTVFPQSMLIDYVRVTSL